MPNTGSSSNASDAGQPAVSWSIPRDRPTAPEFPQS